MPTGEVELQVDELLVLSTSTALPFQLDEEQRRRGAAPALPLARPAPPAHAAQHPRARAASSAIIRDEMEREGFVDIETPIFWKPTPEGARDFVVPSRLQPGHFFALPQSPQIAKQLLVISGFERYYQIARCFRDEDLRADRLQELTQLDVEMAFPDQDFLFGLMERIVERIWRECDRCRAEAAVPAHALRRGDAPLRHRPARPALRHGDPGSDRGHPRLGVRRVRERGGGALHRGAEGVLALGAAGAREPRPLVGGEGARVHRLPRRRRAVLADREVPLGRPARPVAPAGPHAALRRRRAAHRRQGARPAAPPARRASST